MFARIESRSMWCFNYIDRQLARVIMAKMAPSEGHTFTNLFATFSKSQDSLGYVNPDNGFVVPHFNLEDYSDVCQIIRTEQFAYCEWYHDGNTIMWLKIVGSDIELSVDAIRGFSEMSASLLNLPTGAILKMDFIEATENTLEYGTLPKEPQVSGEVKNLYTLEKTISEGDQYVLCKWAFDISSVCAGNGLVKPLEKKYILTTSVIGSCLKTGERVVRIVYQWGI